MLIAKAEPTSTDKKVDSIPSIYPQNYFQSPLDLPLTIVGNFGEPRRLHFHTGLDFRTNQEEGHIVFAVADGFISRINVSGAGYGNALYVTHANGYTSVYGHLLKFHPRIETRLRQEQYAKESFAVDFPLKKDVLYFKKGDTIAWSGNTGGSGGPHLHFEIRDSLDHIYNPLLFGYKLKDDIKPIVSYLKFYALGSLKGLSDGYRVRVLPKAGIYTPEIPLLKLNDKQVGISVNAYDKLNLTPAQVGIYNMTVFDGDKMIYEYQIDAFSFPDKRDVLSHIDYPIFTNEGKKSFHKSFVEPGNDCPVYSNVSNAGVIDLSDNKTHAIHIEISDYEGNVSAIQLNLKYDTTSILFKAKAKPYTTLFKYDAPNQFYNSALQLDLPKGCLYDNVFFNYAVTASLDASILSKVHTLDNSNTQLADWFNIAIKPENLPSNLQQKAILIYKDNTGVTASRGGKFENGFIKSRTREFGTYYIKLDTVPPTIAPLNVVTGKNMRIYKKLIFRLSDSLSGIADFDTYIDGKWTVTEYDAKYSSLVHTLDLKLAPGTHTFKITAVDERNNEASYTVKFVM